MWGTPPSAAALSLHLTNPTGAWQNTAESLNLIPTLRSIAHYHGHRAAYVTMAMLRSEAIAAPNPLREQQGHALHAVNNISRASDIVRVGSRNSPDNSSYCQDLTDHSSVRCSLSTRYCNNQDCALAQLLDKRRHSGEAVDR